MSVGYFDVCWKSVLVFIAIAGMSFSQSRIKYNNRDLFLNGANIAWVDFANDVGPGITNFTMFENWFMEMKANGGNSFRLWLHTDGSSSPQFINTTNMVIGPGTGTIQDLKRILDLAWQNDIGLMLCLWSHDMLRSSKSSIIKIRNRKLLTDTAATSAYINNALIPMVEALKGHPGILAWEIFNEPEGITDEFQWDGWDHVPIYFIQRFINLTAGAIHRIDPSAQVTNGSWSMPALTDVPTLAKKSPESRLNSFTEEQKKNIESTFEAKYDMRLSADDIVKHFSPTAAAFNYYTDARLIDAGGDPDGTLDFYTVHYYNWMDNSVSPFHNPYSHWMLDKPLAIAEFHMDDIDDLDYRKYYEMLYNTGYAGALSWQWWGDRSANPYNLDHSRTLVNLNYMYEFHPADVVVNPETGTIYSFRAYPDVIEKGDSTLLTWEAQEGSSVELDNVSVPYKGSKYVSPLQARDYRLTSQGMSPSQRALHVNVNLPGLIYSLNAYPNVIASGEQSLLVWNTSRGSQVTLNGDPVKEDDSLFITINETTEFKLIANGEVQDTSSVVVTVEVDSLVNRALNKNVTALSSEQGQPEFVVDGNLSTIWTSSYSDVQNLEIDLGYVYKINKLVMRWTDAYALKYRIAASKDKVNYILVKNVLNGTGGDEHFTDLDFDARYVKFFFDKRATSGGYSLSEIEAYGILQPLDVNHEPEIPDEFALLQNYPNPFNPNTSFGFRIPAPGFVTVKIHDILGKEIAVLINEKKQAGSYYIDWNAKHLASGVYFYSMKVDGENGQGFYSVKKMTLIK